MESYRDVFIGTRKNIHNQLQVQGGEINMERYYQPEIECAPVEQLKALQDERLVKQVRHVWENVPYYRRKMEEKGVTPEDIKGTQDLHKKLEAKLSSFLGTEDTILYSSCFDANAGLFETLLTEEDAIISDELNHASIIDGVRLCKAKRFRYKNNNMDDLRAKLEEAKDCRIKLIATDGVFSMDGIVANLQAICDLADEYDALVMVDDSHAVGFMGEHGHGTAEYCGVEDRVDIITGTFGKALGGASGGYTSGRKEIIDLLRQRSRPYLFSNTVAPAICEATIAVLDLLDSDPSYRERLFNNTKIFAEEIGKLGLDVTFRGSPILPIMLYDEHKASEFAARAMEKGIYVVAFSYPVVPKGKARIRTQISAALTESDIRDIVAKFAEIKEEMGL